MRLIDADELRRRYIAEGYQPIGEVWRLIDAAPTVEAPEPLARDGVLAEVARIEATGDTAVVEIQFSHSGVWAEVELGWVKRWTNPDVPRWNVRVRVVPAATEWVPLTKLVGRTIKGGTEPVYCTDSPNPSTTTPGWRWRPITTVLWQHFPDGTLDIDTAKVLVLAEGGRVMGAPDELRQAIATAIGDADCTTDNMTVAELDAAYLIHADAVLAVPAIADALARDAKVREIVQEWETDVRTDADADGDAIRLVAGVHLGPPYPETGK